MASLCAAQSSVASTSFLCNHNAPLQCRNPSSSAEVAPLKGRYPTIVCGRGDKRTAKGKRARGSFGNCRPKDSSKSSGLAVTPMPPRPKKKDEFDDGEYIHVDIDETLFTS